jgi:hypothetical protein
VTEIEGSGQEEALRSVRTNPVNDTTIYLVPEFYFIGEKKSRDTVFKFLCYDVRDTLIPSVKDYDSVRYYSLFKNFIDSTHTYKDNGVDKPLPVSVIIKRYDRTGTDKWMSVEYPSNKFTELKGFRDAIVNADSTYIVDPATGKELLLVHKYYKVIKN